MGVWARRERGRERDSWFLSTCGNLEKECLLLYWGIESVVRPAVLPWDGVSTRTEAPGRVSPQCVPTGAGSSCPLYSKAPLEHYFPKLQALVYDILPLTTAVFSYAIGPRKLPANEQFFCWCSNSSRFVTNTTQVISDVCFITDHVAYASSNKNKIHWDGTFFFFFFYPRWMRLMFTCVLGR